jgi:hypothetical protein
MRSLRHTTKRSYLKEKLSYSNLSHNKTSLDPNCSPFIADNTLNEQYHKIDYNLKSKAIPGALCSVIPGTTRQYDNTLTHCFRLLHCYLLLFPILRYSLYGQFLIKRKRKKVYLICSFEMAIQIIIMGKHGLGFNMKCRNKVVVYNDNVARIYCLAILVMNSSYDIQPPPPNRAARWVPTMEKLMTPCLVITYQGYYGPQGGDQHRTNSNMLTARWSPKGKKIMTPWLDVPCQGHHGQHVRSGTVQATTCKCRSYCSSSVARN